MSLLSQVSQISGTTRADVIRVLTHGGTTQADWAIAHAIQAVTGRSSYELMMLAGREQEIAQIWADSAAPASLAAPTNPHAEYDPEVVVYPEDTSPESPNQIAPHHPNETNTDEDDETEQLRTQAWAAVAAITSATKEAIDRMVARWITPSAIYAGLTRVVRSSRHPRARKLRAIYDIAA